MSTEELEQAEGTYLGDGKISWKARANGCEVHAIRDMSSGMHFVQPFEDKFVIGVRMVSSTGQVISECLEMRPMPPLPRVAPRVVSLKERRIRCPEIVDGIRYRAMCATSGEVLECTDIAVLIRRMAAGLSWGDNEWSFEREVED